MKGASGFSIDVEDLFYSITHEQLLVFVKLRIEESEKIPFQNLCGLTVGFLELLAYYIGSTVVSFEGELYSQKSGTCIGSRVPAAPVLCDIFLGISLTRQFQKKRKMEETDNLNLFRYVDDFCVGV